MFLRGSIVPWKGYPLISLAHSKVLTFSLHYLFLQYTSTASHSVICSEHLLPGLEWLPPAFDILSSPLAHLPLPICLLASFPS